MDADCAGWSDIDHDPCDTLPLCDHHAYALRRLDTHRANLIARACPWCVGLPDGRTET